MKRGVLKGAKVWYNGHVFNENKIMSVNKTPATTTQQLMAGGGKTVTEIQARIRLARAGGQKTITELQAELRKGLPL